MFFKNFLKFFDDLNFFIFHSIPLLRFPFYRTAKIQKFLTPTTFISKKF